MARTGTIPEPVEEALEYFLRNPEVRDTLEGIARWRLLEQRVAKSVESVDRALRWLVAEGYVVEVATRSGPPLFMLNAERVAAARTLVRGLQRRDAGSE